MRSIARKIKEERGSSVVESLLPLLIFVVLIVVSTIVFSAFSNANLAQHAATKTGLYASSAGYWPVQLQDECERLLPGDAETKSCELFSQNPVSGAYDIPVDPVCDNGAAQVDDCLNEPLEKGDDSRYLPYNQPLRLQVTYEQRWPTICWPFVENQCLTQDRTSISRSVIIFSQSRRID